MPTFPARVSRSCLFGFGDFWALLKRGRCTSCTAACFILPSPAGIRDAEPRDVPWEQLKSNLGFSSWACMWESSQWTEVLERQGKVHVTELCSVPQFPSVGMPKERALPGTCTMSCWKARMSQGDSNSSHTLPLVKCLHQALTESSRAPVKLLTPMFYTSRRSIPLMGIHLTGLCHR